MAPPSLVGMRIADSVTGCRPMFAIRPAMPPIPAMRTTRDAPRQRSRAGPAARPTPSKATATVAQRAKQVQPNFVNATDTLGWIQYKKGLYSSAIPLLQECVTKVPQSATYHYHLGMALLATGDRAKSRDQLEAALRLKLAGADAENARKALSR